MKYEVRVGHEFDVVEVKITTTPTKNKTRHRWPVIGAVAVAAILAVSSLVVYAAQLQSNRSDAEIARIAETVKALVKSVVSGAVEGMKTK
jgi:hypothetical protein